ncbi:hypothetical protein L1856_05090 [Streptomyces sp. Tue 6430]|nr:hypothetical protein [Streptomyces sp. Tue 6430]
MLPGPPPHSAAVTIVVCTALTTLIGLIAGLGERTATERTGPAPTREPHPQHTTT